MDIRIIASRELASVGYHQMASDVLRETDLIIIKMYRRLAKMKASTGREQWKKYAEYLYSEGRRCFESETEWNKRQMSLAEQDKMMSLIFEYETEIDFINEISDYLLEGMKNSFLSISRDTAARDLGLVMAEAARKYYTPMINKEFARIHDWETRQKEEEEIERTEMERARMSAPFDTDRS